jgi:glycosyltransferase involved in cell wall biosynthesis
MEHDFGQSEARVTLVMPARDVERWIEEAILTIRAQRLAEWVLVVVNDGSRDNTPHNARLASRDDHRIIVVDANYHDLNEARYAGLRLALTEWGKTEFLAFPDGDDTRDQRFLVECVAALEKNPDILAVFTGIKNIDENGEPVDFPLLTNTTKGELGIDRLLLGDFPPRTTSGMVWRRDKLMLPFKDPPSEDYEMSARMLDKYGGKIFGVDEDLLSYRTRPGQWTQPKNASLIISAVDRIYAEYVPRMKNPENRWQVYQIFAAAASSRGCPEHAEYYVQIAEQLSKNPDIPLKTYAQYSSGR